MEAESEDDMTASQSSLERPTPHRGNTMVHVCWHRNTSVSMVDFSIAVEVPAKPQTSDLPLPSVFSFSVLFILLIHCVISQWEQCHTQSPSLVLSAHFCCSTVINLNDFT